MRRACHCNFDVNVVERHAHNDKFDVVFVMRRVKYDKHDAEFVALRAQDDQGDTNCVARRVNYDKVDSNVAARRRNMTNVMWLARHDKFDCAQDDNFDTKFVVPATFPKTPQSYVLNRSWAPLYKLGAPRCSFCMGVEGPS